LEVKSNIIGLELCNFTSEISFEVFMAARF
jgi:hypothetical protein